MFGRDFGPFHSRDRHVFEEAAIGCQALADALDLCRREPVAPRPSGPPGDLG